MGMQHPAADDYALNDPQSATVPAGNKAVFTWSPANTGTTVVIPELSASKEPETSYTVKLDGSVRYEAEIPPTDIDDSTQTWLPPVRASEEIEVTVRNFAEVTRTYHCQLKGWETE